MSDASRVVGRVNQLKGGTAMTKEIMVMIDEDGTVTVEANGFVGSSCETELAPLLEAIGATEVEETRKPEYYEKEVLETVGA